VPLLHNYNTLLEFHVIRTFGVHLGMKIRRSAYFGVGTCGVIDHGVKFFAALTKNTS
jgi:hypothetical protein